MVTSVDPRGPAETAGIRDGDEILAMDDMSTEGADVLGMLKGEAGQQVVLLVKPRPRAMSSGVFGIPGAGSISMAVPPQSIVLTRYTPPPNWWDNVTALFSGQNAAATSQGAAAGGGGSGSAGAAAAQAPAPVPAPEREEPCGIGLGIASREGKVWVTEVVAGGPAANSRVIYPGDEIVQVDGQAVGGLSTHGVLQLVLGPAGTDVVVEIRRPNSETRISVTVQRSRPMGHASRGRTAAAAAAASPSSNGAQQQAPEGGGGGARSWSWMFGSPGSGSWGTAHFTSTQHSQDFSSSSAMSVGHRTSSSGPPPDTARYQEHQGALSEEEALQLAMMESMCDEAAGAQPSATNTDTQPRASISDEDRQALASILQEDSGGSASRGGDAAAEQRGIFVCPFGCGERFVGSSIWAQMAPHMRECAQNPVPQAQRAGASGERGAALRTALQSMRGRTFVVPYGSIALIDGGRPVRFVPMVAHRVPPLLRAQAQHGDLDVEAMQELLAAMHPGVEFGEFAGMGMEAPPRGTDACVLSSLPTSTFKSAESKESDHTQCCICQMEYEDGDKTVALPCLHPFHQECVTRWLERSTKCPICKHDVETNTLAGRDDGHPAPGV